MTLTTAQVFDLHAIITAVIESHKIKWTYSADESTPIYTGTARGITYPAGSRDIREASIRIIDNIGGEHTVPVSLLVKLMDKGQAIITNADGRSTHGKS